MLKQPQTKYRALAPIGLNDCRWPDAVLTRAPIWLSNAIHDPNRALVEPVDLPHQRHEHPIQVIDYHWPAIRVGASAQAVAYLGLCVDNTQALFGVAIDADAISASRKANVSSLKRHRMRTARSAQLKAVAG